ncbi:IPT/TIG domain-containing protein [Streptomyces goshikiensis]|uniref:IPT/TIG domain-containing protein n=1 Tax=Streptomyces goshikiensis TaxID=1942 RepID=UPI002E0FFD94|nr:IPT/TIG domain-containing protein [Streptomyces goshikiensis]
MTSTALVCTPRGWWRVRATALVAAGVTAFAALAAAPVSAGAAGTAAERPTVTSITPAVGPAVGGQQFTVTGTNLLGARILFEFENYATNVVCAATSCTGTTPAGKYAGQPQPVIAVNDTDNSLEENVTYTHYRIPQVTGVSPASGTAAGGSQGTITGRDLTGATSITFGPGRKATNLNCPESTTCTATSPSGTAGTGVDVQVTSPGGTSAVNTAARFAYTSTLPTVTALSPNSGPVAGGNLVTITGTNFTCVDSVAFGTKYAASGNCSSDTACTMRVPAGVTGIVDVRVHNPYGWSAAVAADRYAYGPPTITAINPATGPAGGGNKVTLTGTNLADTYAVTFGPGHNATGLSCTATSCTVTAPAGASLSKVPVQAVNAAGTSPAASATMYSYGR